VMPGATAKLLRDGQPVAAVIVGQGSGSRWPTPGRSPTAPTGSACVREFGLTAGCDG
jgi:hypothetical protein